MKLCTTCLKRSTCIWFSKNKDKVDLEHCEKYKKDRYDAIYEIVKHAIESSHSEEGRLFDLADLATCEIENIIVETCKKEISTKHLLTYHSNKLNKAIKQYLQITEYDYEYRRFYEDTLIKLEEKINHELDSLEKLRSKK